jgi:RimJ/RimL family protein N-acetyltransferase
MRIALERCLVRSFEPGDPPSIARHANDPLVARNLRDRFPHPYTEQDGVEWVAFARSAQPETAFAIEVGGAAVGGVGVEIKDDIFRRTAELGYWLGREHWGRGIATEVVRAVSDWAFNNLDIARLYAGVFESNTASARVLEKAGFLYEGRLRKAVTKDGQTLDELIYARVV